MTFFCITFKTSYEEPNTTFLSFKLEKISSTFFEKISYKMFVITKAKYLLCHSFISFAESFKSF